MKTYYIKHDRIDTEIDQTLIIWMIPTIDSLIANITII